MLRIFLIALLLFPSLLPAEQVVVPPENQAQGVLPDMVAAEELARQLVAAIEGNNAVSATDVFFPADAFLALKDMKNSAQYHTQLTDWYRADLARENAKLKGKTGLVFDGFKKGSCKWKAKGTETNKIPYWSCYRNKFYAMAGAERLEFELRAMINWGPRWYVTHLGPIPKS